MSADEVDTEETDCLKIVSGVFERWKGNQTKVWFLRRPPGAGVRSGRREAGGGHAAPAGGPQLRTGAHGEFAINTSFF